MAEPKRCSRAADVGADWPVGLRVVATIPTPTHTTSTSAPGPSALRDRPSARGGSARSRRDSFDIGGVGGGCGNGDPGARTGPGGVPGAEVRGDYLGVLEDLDGRSGDGTTTAPCSSATSSVGHRSTEAQVVLHRRGGWHRARSDGCGQGAGRQRLGLTLGDARRRLVEQQHHGPGRSHARQVDDPPQSRSRAPSATCSGTSRDRRGR